MPPSVFALHIFVTILKDENARLVNFYGVFRHAISVVAARGTIVNISLGVNEEYMESKFRIYLNA